MSTNDRGVSVLSPCGYGGSSCGYCHSAEDTSYTYGAWAHSLTCADYQALIDRGWRRSGKYLYKPDLSKSCCPQYTIRLDANGFQPTKSQRKVINKFNRYIEGTWQPKQDGEDENMKETPTRPSNVNYDTSKTLPENIHKVEDKDKLSHFLKIELEPSSFSDEKYQIYRKYQIEIHHDKPSKLSERSFRRFLIDSPLQPEPFPQGKQGCGYGSFHQKYILDGKLIAVAVLDILPKCVSSVYFMYDPEYAFLGLGKYSALREIGLVQEFSESTSSQLHYYYMGFYIHNCQKMKYKGSYHPSDLLDAEKYTWHPIEDCKKLLDKAKYVVFSDPNGKTRRDPDRLLPGTMNPKDVNMQDLGRLRILFEDGNSLPVHLFWRAMPQETRETIKEFIAVIGPDMANQMFIQ